MEAVALAEVAKQLVNQAPHLRLLQLRWQIQCSIRLRMANSHWSVSID